jgi:xanthine dehydrogenase accessory factor
MMDEWQLAAAAPAAQVILVTVAACAGSVPRGPGTRMVVTAGALAGTVGGGHLELRAIEIGRAMLDDGRSRHFERFALGPTLGQCCGGVVHLAFETVDPAQAALLAQRRNLASWRLSALDGEAVSSLFGEDGTRIAGPPLIPFEAAGATRIIDDGAGRRYLLAKVDAPRAHVVLFGAGHVGTALVSALAALPCTVTWIDERADLFPAKVPANVTVEASESPALLVADAPAGSYYLVMTHSHALDQQVTEAILARPGVAWFGLIGSHTKRAQFERRLLARGVDETRIAAMACPIGLPGIAGKEPGVIAASVCAQLLMLWSAAPSNDSPTMAEPA